MYNSTENSWYNTLPHPTPLGFNHRKQLIQYLAPPYTPWVQSEKTADTIFCPTLYPLSSITENSWYNTLPHPTPLGFNHRKQLIQYHVPPYTPWVQSQKTADTIPCLTLYPLSSITGNSWYNTLPHPIPFGFNHRKQLIQYLAPPYTPWV